MALTIGTRLGPYQVLALIGGGGMGEVYRGWDSRLDRDVAIKVLPAAVADNATRRARFEREARAISQLSHPNICAIYDVGEQDGVAYLVMEYIEGETLELRLRAGALPWSSALQIAVQIASAVAVAHERGIVHRDLKPANIMYAGSTIKLLDFGIAKLIDDDDARRVDAPTVSLTAEHKVVGTLNYMAPEQLEGRPIDERTDIFALGALLYEMLTGRRAFDGTSAASVTAAVIASDPPPLSAPTYTGATIPPALEHIVRRALAKPPDDRWQTAHDLAHELEWIAEDPRRASTPSRSTPALRRLAAMAMAAALVLATGAWSGWTLGARSGRADVKVVTSFTIEAPDGTKFGKSMGKVAVSPDGSKIAFVATKNGRPSIWLYELDSGQTRHLAETDGSSDPFWKPDSQSIGFYADEGTSIKRVDLEGGSVSLVTPVKPENPIGHEFAACWMPDDTIVFPLSDGLWRVPSRGGTLIQFIALDVTRGDKRLGSPFPVDAKRVLYRVRRELASESRVGGTSGTRTVLPDIKSNAVLAAGHVVFVDGSRLRAQPFDTARLELTGEPIEIASGVDTNPSNARANFSASDDVLAYFPGAPPAWNWIDRFGHRGGTVGEPGRTSFPAAAPDGSHRIALTRIDPSVPGQGHILVRDDQGRETGLSHDPGSCCPVWSSDGRWIAYRRPVPGSSGPSFEFHKASPSGVGEDQLIAQFDGQAMPLDWSPDGTLLYTYDNNVWAILPNHTKRQITSSGNVDRAARLSPDGHWLAYAVSDQGQTIVWVQAFPNGSAPTRSPGHGFDPGWSPDGRELYYMTNEGVLTAVPMSVGAGDVPVFGSPVPLFSISPTSLTFFLHVFTVSPDGRFLVSEPPAYPARINVVLNWAARLQR